MDRSDAIAFRLPGSAVRRAFVRHTALIAAILLVLHLASGQGSLQALLGAGMLGLVVLIVAYAVTARHVWLSVSPTGLAATGYMGRTVAIPWSIPVKVVATRKSGYQGHAVSELANSGFVPSSYNAIFVPGAIAASPAFAAAVGKCAPPGHPLRAIVAHAA